MLFIYLVLFVLSRCIYLFVYLFIYFVRSLVLSLGRSVIGSSFSFFIYLSRFILFLICVFLYFVS